MLDGYVPYLLTEKQKYTREIVPTYAKKIFMNKNVVTGDEFWIHSLKPQQQNSNRVWLVKDARRPCITKRSAGVKKVMYAIFFNTKRFL